jgi:putative ABC transport system substrate-binding protein
LRDLGHIAGRTLAIEYRYAEGTPERPPELAAELVRLRPDLILSLGGGVTAYAKKATPAILLVPSP